MSNIVAIVGRPNVGKSTLFNRLIKARKAIVHEESGVTRDRHYGKSYWNGKEFSVIDTGGYVANSEDVFESEIRKQVKLAIEEADVIVFVTDVISGISDLDDAIADMLRRTKKEVLLVVNKADNTERFFEANEFYRLGFDEIYPVSAINGTGTGDLLDKIAASLPEENVEDTTDEIPKLAVIGRPNVGKSSLINALIGEERNIVTEVAGTTRDSIYTHYNKYNRDFYLIDTAGLRKKGKVHENVEFYSVMRSIRAIENADVCLLMLDAVRGIESQDVNIFRIAVKNRKGIVLLVNKWDLVEKDHRTVETFKATIKNRFAPFTDVPVVFISAVNKQRIFKSLETALEVSENRKQRIATSKLNERLLPDIQKYPPPSVKGRYIKIKYVTQLPNPAPAFAFFCNFPQYIKEPYHRYIENRLREHFHFSGVPLQIYFRKK